LGLYYVSDDKPTYRKQRNKEEPDDQVAEQWETFGYQARVPEGCFLDEDYILVCPDNPDYYPPFVTEYWYQTTTKGPLLATEWDQLSQETTYIGYNNFVRFNNCSQGTSPAGCVAVAMGQIMKNIIIILISTI